MKISKTQSIFDRRSAELNNKFTTQCRRAGCVWHHQLVNSADSSSCWFCNCDNWNWMFAYSSKSSVSLFFFSLLSLLRLAACFTIIWMRIATTLACRIYWHLNWPSRCLRFIKDQFARARLIALWENKWKTIPVDEKLLKDQCVEIIASQT